MDRSSTTEFHGANILAASSCQELLNAAELQRESYIVQGSMLSFSQQCNVLFVMSLNARPSDRAIVAAGWVLGNMLPFFYLLKVLGMLRVKPEDETIGLDESYHGGSAYPGLSEDSSFHPDKTGNSGPTIGHKADNGFGPTASQVHPANVAFSWFESLVVFCKHLR